MSCKITKWSSLNHKKIKKRQLGQQPDAKRHLNAIGHLKKHEVSCVTQLRSNHIHLNQYLAKFKQRTNPACDGQEGVETIRPPTTTTSQNTPRAPTHAEEMNLRQPRNVSSSDNLLQFHMAAEIPLGVGQNF
ncbi:hypothetical protein CROQUDRAFT_85527 [Cronartium quercuum f. sp. fusiforme G11]|uniref:Uncharacterized protein n=1 Tax=Cronartium quercuum f. sp. fusiforme G11 TaxID=708437 RepID=A0A9P6THT8_9BASI|nr:hypothetical protein CROQUDRAFT_85527 [Cronartium quercuum f. sp. fusiforme G11]